MLHFIRERAQGWLAYGIVILIIIPFALWGVNQYFSGAGEVTVAKVDGAEIQQRELQRAYLQQRRQMQQMLGDRFNPEQFPEKVMKREVLEGMVRDRLLIQVARDAGFWIGDAQLAQAIRSTSAFQGENGFSKEQYERTLRAQGMNPSYFEARMRRSMLSGQLKAGVAGSAFLTGRELDTVLRLKKQRRDIGYLVLPLERFLADVEAGDEEVERYYQDHKERYVVPERVKVAYLELDLEEMREGIEVSEETLRQTYEERAEQFSSPEERRVRHILIEVPRDGGDEAEAAAKAEAERLLARLDEGAAFAELAREHSDDPGSAEEGGDLGFMGKGVMDEAFEQAAFSLEPGEPGGPVRSAFGYHIIKVEEVRGGDVQPFEEVRDQLKQRVQRERAEARFYEQSEQLANLTYEQPDALEPAAEALGLTVQKTGYFDRSGGEGIASNQEVVKTAFSGEVLAEGFNSQPVELDTNHLVVLRVEDHRPERQQSLDEVRDRVAEAVRRQKASEAVRAAADTLAERLAGGEEPVAVADTEGLQWQRHEGLARSGEGEVPGPVRRTAFAVPRPAEGERTAQAVELASGDQAVVAVSRVVDGEPAEVPADERQKERRDLVRAEGRIAYESLLSYLRSRADVTIRADQL